MTRGGVSYCDGRNIEFTRSRAYRKNDQVWIEQKNGSVIRRFVGHERYSGAMRLYVNYHQPSCQLLTKSRNGGSVARRYCKPATPCDRLLDRADVSEEMKSSLSQNRAALDPVSLLHSIRKSQAALRALSAPGSANASPGDSLESSLSELPDLWRQGEVRPTHTPKRRKYQSRVPHTWRTRPDPFEGAWSLILEWLQERPDVGATELMDHLIRRNPDRYSRRQLHILQRGVRQWHGVMANKLVHASAEQGETHGERLGNIRPVGVN